MKKNKLFYGDNLDILRNRDYFPNECVDLIYLDPPFNSNQSYNVLFSEQNGSRSAAQIRAFEDTWQWDRGSESAYKDILKGPEKVALVMQAFRKFLGESNVMAYLAMMAPRLVELHRVLKPTGSLYLHCDPTASHFLKLLLDAVFGIKNIRNEIIWRRMNPSGFKGKTSIGRGHDIILLYSKSKHAIYNPIYLPYSEDYIKQRFRHIDKKTGRRFKDSFLGTATTQETIEKLKAADKIYYTKTGGMRLKIFLDESPGIPLDDVWSDIIPINSQAQERLGYPTQKPEALLERILNASTNTGDIVLDPFCGCGTTIVAAQKLKRHWIGIDITHLAIGLIKHRLKTTFGKRVLNNLEMHEEPVDVRSAEELAKKDRFQFQCWALGLVGARHAGSGRKGADQGIDGRLFFQDDPKTTRETILSVKSGKVGVKDIRELKAVVDREKAAIGAFITLKSPTRPMEIEAAKAGDFQSHARSHIKIQILTIEDLFNGKEIDYPQTTNVTLKSAPRKESDSKEDQREMELE